MWLGRYGDVLPRFSHHVADFSAQLIIVLNHVLAVVVKLFVIAKEGAGLQFVNV